MDTNVRQLQILDSAVTHVDILTSQASPSHLRGPPLSLAAQLMQDFEQAAVVASLAAEHFGIEIPGRMESFMLAAYLYSKDQVSMFDQAEESYIKAWHALSTRKRTTQTEAAFNRDTSSIVKGLLALYRDMPAIVKPDLSKDEQFVDMGTALPAVLVAMGVHDALLVKGESNLSILKDEYRVEKSKLQLALVKSHELPSVETFYSSIAECLKPNVRIQRISSSATANDDESRAVEQESERAAKKPIPPYVIPRCSLPSCNVLEDENGELSACKCRSAYYCGRTCQKAHWNDHKKVCVCATHNRTAKQSGQSAILFHMPVQGLV